MTEKITAIIIDITRHNDKLNIVTIYSRTHGRISLLSPSGTGKSAKLRQARLQPLAVINADINFRHSAELQRLGQFSLHTVWHDIYFHPVKRILAIFLSEFLNRFLRASMPDPEMWDYIYNSLLLLDNMKEGIADYHIAFLSSLLPFAGIQPDNSRYQPGYLFNMQTGSFQMPGLNNDHRSHILKPEESRFAAIACRINFYNIKALRLNRQLRIEILLKILQYYSIHFPGSGNIRSLDIIREIFA